jgi:hypothetical protein
LNLIVLIQVERTFQMVADGTITIEGLAAERLNRKGKALVGKVLNKQTGKESSKQSSFGEANWGSATRRYSSVLISMKLRN